MSEWQPIESAPKDGKKFYALIGNLPYVCRYDEHGRLIRYYHGNVATGASYIVHNIDGKSLLEETKPAEYDYQIQGILWKLGFNHEPTHWMPYIPLPAPPVAP